MQRHLFQCLYKSDDDQTGLFMTQLTKGVSGTHQPFRKNINQPSYSSTEIVNPVSHKQSTYTTKFMVTH